MGAVTAREVLARLETHGARLVAGAVGLDRPVTWASTMRARPPAFEGLQSGELALLALGTLRALHAHDDTLTLARLVTDLAERGVAALAVAGLLPPDAPGVGGPSSVPAAMEIPTRASGAIPVARPTFEGERRPATADEIALAEGMGLPLLGLPTGTPLADIERDVIAFVVARRSQAAEPEAPRGVYDALLRASLRGDDDAALGQRLATRLEVAVVLEDGDGPRWCALPARFPLARESVLALLSRRGTRAALRAPPTTALAVPSPEGTMVGGATVGGARLDGETSMPGAARSVRAAPLSASLMRLLAPLRVHDDVAAYLSLVVPLDPSRAAAPSAGAADAPPAGGARVAMLTDVLEDVAPLFALALVRRHDFAGAERRLRTEALDALLTGTYPDEGQMRMRAAQLGHDLDGRHVALVVELPRRVARVVAGDGPASAAVSAAPDVATALTEALPGTWARARGDEVAALIPLAAESGPAVLAELAARVAPLLAPLYARGHGTPHGTAHADWAAGLGGAAVGPEQVRRSYAEARDAARLGRAVLGPGHVARTADLGIYRLLLRLRDDGELAEFCQRTLGPLAAEQRGSDSLLETLEVFFACNGNHSEAARRLNLHRNSLIYRLNRAGELLGQDLEDPELRLSLQLALKGRRVLDL